MFCEPLRVPFAVVVCDTLTWTHHGPSLRVGFKLIRSQEGLSRVPRISRVSLKWMRCAHVRPKSMDINLKNTVNRVPGDVYESALARCQGMSFKS